MRSRGGTDLTTGIKGSGLGDLKVFAQRWLASKKRANHPLPSGTPQGDQPCCRGPYTGGDGGSSGASYKNIKKYEQERMNQSHVHSSWAKHRWIYDFRKNPRLDLYKLLLTERFRPD
jgi:hypothetical protein